MLKKITGQFLILLLIVQTLNLSINSIDFYKPIEISNSSDNQDYVDSMIEFVVENMLGYSKDTFHDKANADNFSRQQQNLIHFDLKWLPNSQSYVNNQEISFLIISIIPQSDRLISLYFKEVPAKPPQIQLS
ncbi:MAG: hypothetical protein WCK78_05490 [Paludibacter sp.]